jgi:SAM-dependent methyltransferase
MFYRIYDLIGTMAATVYAAGVKRVWVQPALNSIGRGDTILEIGGGYNPQFTKAEYPNVYHLDHATADELRKKYEADPVVQPFLDGIQPVDFVSDGSPIENLIPEDLRFDVIFSSHSLEHQVDLIGHLESLEKLLRPGGRVVMVIPDYRRCFDVLRYPTTAIDAIIVHRAGARVHRDKQLFEFYSKAVNVNPHRKVRSIDLRSARFYHSLKDADDALKRSEDPDAAYEDVHAWVFSPDSFRLLLLELYMLGHTHLRPSLISPSYRSQFFVVLEPQKGLASESIEQLEEERLRLTKKLRH